MKLTARSNPPRPIKGMSLGNGERKPHGAIGANDQFQHLLAPSRRFASVRHARRVCLWRRSALFSLWAANESRPSGQKFAGQDSQTSYAGNSGHCYAVSPRIGTRLAASASHAQPVAKAVWYGGVELRFSGTTNAVGSAT